jgi:DNA primase
MRKNYSMDTIISKVRQKRAQQIPSCPSFQIPDHFLDVLYDEHEEYLRLIHASTAETLLDIKENRVVFLIRDPDTGQLQGAIGRAMNKHKLPKWKRYDRNPDLLYFSGHGTTGVLVEDVASACAVGNAGYTGIALLGTSLHDNHIHRLLRFQHLIVALDKDASNKAIKIKKRLDDYRNTSVVLLPDDLKYFPPSDIQVILS